MTTLTREAIKASSEPEYFEVSAGGMTGKARKLRSSQLSDYEHWFSDKNGNILEDRIKLRRERLIAMCLVNDDGSLMYPGDEFKELADCDGGIVRDLFEQIEEKCGIRKYQEAKTVKNSEDG